MTDRDYCAEMAAHIDEATSHGPYVPRTVAEEIVDKLHANDSELLAGWLDAKAGTILWQEINNRDRSLRARARHQAPKAAFSRALRDHDNGDDTELRKFLDMPIPIPVADGTTCLLGDLREDDLNFAADRYRRLASNNLLMEDFLRAIAKKVGGRRVQDVYSEGQLADMFGSLSAA